MKCCLLLLLLSYPALEVCSQAPDWHWARLLDNNVTASELTVLATNEGGCYVQQGDQVHRYNDFGDHLWTVGFSEAVRLFRTADQGNAGFIMQYQESADAAGTSFIATPGISFVTGFFAADGSLFDLQNYPALLGLQNTVTVADVHRGPGGDLLLLGHFSDLLQVGDTTIIGYGNSGFLVRVSTDGILQWAMSLMNTEAGSFGGNSAQVKQSVTGDIYINLGSPYPGSVSDTLFEQGGSAFARFTSEGDLLWSSITDGGSLAGDRVLFDLRSDGGLYYARETLGMTNEIAMLGAVDGNGELVWETPYIDHFSPTNVSMGPLITSDLLKGKIEHLKAYPNPARVDLFVTVPEVLKGERAYLYDLVGRSVNSFTFLSSTERIDITGLSSGIYLLNCRDQSVRIVIE